MKIASQHDRKKEYFEIVKKILKVVKLLLNFLHVDNWCKRLNNRPIKRFNAMSLLIILYVISYQSESIIYRL